MLPLPNLWLRYACLCSLYAATPMAHAQEGTSFPPEPQPGVTTPVTASQPASTADELRRRDQAIQNLQQRIDQLERKLNAIPAVRSQPPSPTATASTDGEDETSERALEWALIRQGGLLLTPWSFELQPGIGYSYRDVGTLSLSSNTIFDVPSVLRNETLSTDLTLRLGLPLGSQVEVYVPYILDTQRDVTFSSPGFNINESQSASGLGDISVTLSKQLLTESGALPNLLGALSWKSTTGDTGNTIDPNSVDPNQPSLISIGSGYQSFQGSLTMVKSQEPLVFLGSLSYAANLSETINGADINPGDAIGLRLGTILSASPDSSWRLALNLARFSNTELNGVDIPGSDATTGLLEIGVSSVLSAQTLLDFTAGFGLTNNSPDFTVSVALPIRFF